MKKRRGMLSTRTVIKDNRSGEVLVDESEDEQIEVKGTRSSWPCGTVRAVNRLTISAGFQSATIEIGGEIPWVMRKGRVLKDFTRGLVKFEALVERRLVRKMSGVQSQLKELGKDR